jgi:hypothetical protein
MLKPLFFVCHAEVRGISPQNFSKLLSKMPRASTNDCMEFNW